MVAGKDGGQRHVPLPLRLLDRLTQALNIGGSLLIFALMLLIGADVFGRNLLGTPIAGVPELVTLSIVAIVFLQIPQALRAGRMTRAEAVIGTLNAKHPTIGHAVETTFDLAAMAVVGTIVYATWPIFTRALKRNEFVGAVGDFTAPVWPVKAMILVGGTVLALQFAARIARRYGYGSTDDAV